MEQQLGRYSEGLSKQNDVNQFLFEEFVRPGVVHADHKPDCPPDAVVDAQSGESFLIHRDTIRRHSHVQAQLDTLYIHAQSRCFSVPTTALCLTEIIYSFDIFS